jgi:hypothetical protein
MLPKRPEETTNILNIPSAIVAILVRSTTEITLSYKLPVHLKLHLNPRQNTSLDLIVIFALQPMAIRRSLPRAGPHPSRSLPNLELFTSPSTCRSGVAALAAEIEGLLMLASLYCAVQPLRQVRGW